MLQQVLDRISKAVSLKRGILGVSLPNADSLAFHLNSAWLAAQGRAMQGKARGIHLFRCDPILLRYIPKKGNASCAVKIRKCTSPC